jgi:hypothetical protein
MTDVHLQVAGVPLVVRAADGAFARRVADRFAGRPAPFDEELPDQVPLPVEVAGRTATLRFGRWRGAVDLEAATVEAPPHLVLADALVRAAVAWKLAERGALLLHASAFVAGGGAVVAFGRSGAGKSTVAAAHGPALSDELVRLRRDGGGWEAGGTPWWRGTGGRAPLRALVWLVRGEAPSVRRVRGAELFRALTREAGRWLPEPTFQRRVFELCADLAAVGALRVAASEGRVAEELAEALA